jgi:putative ABC transport system permease protein
MLRSLPVSDPQRLVVVNDSTTTSGNNSWTFAIWDNIRQRAQAFDGALAWSAQRFSHAQAGETQFVDGMYVSRDYFTTLGVPVLIGRTITADDDARGGGKDGPVAVISYAFWQRQYGCAADVLGRTLTIESVPFTIIGVTPPEFFGTEVGRAFDVAIPLNDERLIRGKETSLDRRGTWWLNVMLRLKPRHSLDSATLRSLQAQIRDNAMPQDWLPRLQKEFLKKPFSPMSAASVVRAQDFHRVEP